MWFGGRVGRWPIHFNHFTIPHTSHLHHLIELNYLFSICNFYNFYSFYSLYSLSSFPFATVIFALQPITSGVRVRGVRGVRGVRLRVSLPDACFSFHKIIIVILQTTGQRANITNRTTTTNTNATTTTGDCCHVDMTVRCCHVITNLSDMWAFSPFQYTHKHTHTHTSAASIHERLLLRTPALVIEAPSFIQIIQCNLPKANWLWFRYQFRYWYW